MTNALGLERAIILGSFDKPPEVKREYVTLDEPIRATFKMEVTGDPDFIRRLFDGDLVVLERARVERLIGWAELGHRLVRRGQIHHSMRGLVPHDSLQESDLDPLT